MSACGCFDCRQIDQCHSSIIDNRKAENADLKERIDKYWKECDRFEEQNEKLKKELGHEIEFRKLMANTAAGHWKRIEAQNKIAEKYIEWINSISHSENCECGHCSKTIEEFEKELGLE